MANEGLAKNRTYEETMQNLLSKFSNEHKGRSLRKYNEFSRYKSIHKKNKPIETTPWWRSRPKTTKNKNQRVASKETTETVEISKGE